MLPDILTAVADKLTRSGVPGAFSDTPYEGLSMVRWTGKRSHQGEAERALVDALEAAGLKAERVPGMGVRVFTDETRAVGDTECVHNVEPDESTVRECELLAAE
jgi:hypothetical protein